MFLALMLLLTYLFLLEFIFMTCKNKSHVRINCSEYQICKFCLLTDLRQDNLPWTKHETDCCTKNKYIYSDGTSFRRKTYQWYSISNPILKSSCSYRFWQNNIAKVNTLKERNWLRDNFIGHVIKQLGDYNSAKICHQKNCWWGSLISEGTNRFSEDTN